ncbi:penicillin-binding transpeptidase domain-containing protein [Gynurincola endophyticus]|uniref:penicillin-binding transpeptidase domain-containing protein n=1 Tax=Gynurincola endophyticus TaxID=2479004 RepID=UPI000F8F379E|nr:penicillin-binding transpeptidase domain-containing protein [Gynurincola endophyticus]
MKNWILATSLMIISLFGCTPNNVTKDDTLKKYFDEWKADGTFAFFNNGQGDFHIYNLPRYTDGKYLPASTFKIVNSLIGVEKGVIKDSTSIINWNGAGSGRAECDANLSMNQAFRLSCPNWYQELARRIGATDMKKYLDTLGYGSFSPDFNMEEKLDIFWLDNSLKVTADEQLGLLKKLYFEQLPFLKRTQRIVREMMLWEDDANYKLSYKTGWGVTEEGNQLGWIEGWIEENNHPYFFVLQIESPDANFDMRSARLDILKKILKQYGFFEGKK